MNIFFGPPHVGVQILVDRTPTDLCGINGPYAVALTYSSRPPPNSQPQAVNIHTSAPWPDTIGSFEQLAIGLNAVVRTGRADTVNATLAAGLMYYRISGTARPVGYTTFQLGGHSVLFSDEYRLAASLEPTQVIGFNVGGDLNVPLARYVALVAGYRYSRAQLSISRSG